MLPDYATLKLVWWAIIGLLLAAFALTEGFGLGSGMLLPLAAKTDEQRRIVLNTYGPVAEGNQTWLIATGGCMFAAWPLAYAAILSSLYALLMPALLALLLRPVALHYRSKRTDPRWRSAWDRCLCGTSLLATLLLGIAAGNLPLGLPFRFNAAMGVLPSAGAGGLTGLLHPYALLIGALAVALLCMHGAAWLQWKTDGVVAHRARKLAMAAALLSLLLFAAAGLWLALGVDGYRIIVMPDTGVAFLPTLKMVERAAGAWMDNYRHWPLACAVPAAALAATGLVIGCSARRRALAALLSSGLVLAAVLASAGIAMFPFVAPSSLAPDAGLTIWDAAASHNSLALMFWATLILLPLVGAYSCWAYAILRGKVTAAYIREHRHSAY